MATVENELVPDPYAYLQSSEFTSELFKIEIKNIHLQAGFSQIKKKLTALDLKPHKVKILKGITFVTFKCAEDRDNALQKLDGFVWKGNTLQTKIAKGRADPCLLKRQAENETDDANRLKSAKYDEVPPEERLRDIVTVFWRKTYSEQLEEKTSALKNVLVNLYTKLIKENPILYKRIEPVKSEFGNMICPLNDIISSPVEKHYRNKCEFSIGEDLDKNNPVVGFRFGKYRGGQNSVGSPECTDLLPPSMELTVRVLQRFFTTYCSSSPPTPDAESEHSTNGKCALPRVNLFSDMKAYNEETGLGYWRMATVRVSRSGEVMLMLDIHPQSMSVDDLKEVASGIKYYFIEGEGKEANITSLYFSTRKRPGDVLDSTTATLLHGNQFITETLNGIKFRITCNSFFQVNTLGAEHLYREIGNQCELSESTILLDVCCGTGTIGLALAHLVEKVIGIELSEEAVEDAKINALENNITNASFHAGKAEDLLPSILHDWSNQGKPIVAVVDPPRAGLHSNVVVALRRCSLLNAIIFVSCDAQAATRNFVELGRLESNRYRGGPFVPVHAVPVDLFPQTRHVETIFLLKRSIGQGGTKNN